MSYLPDDRPGQGGADTAPPTQVISRLGMRRRPTQSLGRFFGLTTLGTIVPGAGLLAARKRLWGGLVLGLFVVLALVAAAYFYWKGPRQGAAYLASRPDLVNSLGSVAVGAGVVWLVSLIATAWVTRPKPGGWGRGTLATLFTLLMCALLVVPGVLAGQRALIAADLMRSLFDEKRIQTAPTANIPKIEATDPWSGIARVNVLLLGTDAYPGRPSIRTDSMMVASIDPQTGNTLLIGIPRNLTGWHISPESPMRAVFPSGVANCTDANFSDCELTNYWRTVAEYAAKNPKAYPGDKMPSLTALREVIGDFIGMQIDNVAMIDIRGFVSLVDALGGVEINVKERLPYGYKLTTTGTIVPGSEAGWIEPGRQRLNGREAMWYSRSRGNGRTDFDRMRRQRCVIGALAKQVNPATMVARFPALAKAAKDNLLFDVSLSQLPAWETLGERIQKGKIRSLPFTSKLFDNVHPNYDWVHAYVAHAVDPVNPAPTTDGFGRPLPTATASTSPSPSPSATKGGAATTTAPAEGVVDVAEAC